jgi:D-beta-D-heptose 7-phosphate kinase/D-beta-D-heptose 1-phosphate adenosyltransferase
MTLPPLGPGRVRELVAHLRGRKVLVVGDVMVDRFIAGRVTRLSPEAPVPIVRFESERWRPGGAANVAHNLTALGAEVSLVGLVGADPAADRLRSELAAVGIPTRSLIVDPRRPTVEKVRIVTGRNQQVARIDYEDDSDPGAEVARQIVDAVAREGRDAVAFVVSDYLKGTVSRAVVHALAGLGRPGTPLVVDPKIPHLSCYAGATLVTPNHHEAEAATHRRIRSDEEARDAARDFQRRAGCDAVLITRGEHGMWLSSPDAEGAVPSVAREVADVTGAGDTVVAVMALALAAGATLAESAILANRAAGLVVARFGPAVVTPAELSDAV